MSEEWIGYTGNETIRPPVSAIMLNIYLQDKSAANSRQAVWSSSDMEWNKWTSIQLALTPRDYKVCNNWNYVG